MNHSLPTRAEAEQRAGFVPKPGRAKAAQWTFVHGTDELLVKDVRYSHPLYRFTVGRFLLHHEGRQYRRLAGLPFIPRSFGLLDADALVLERINAQSLGQFEPRKIPADVPERVCRCVEQLHDRGFVHLDLRTRRNILVNPQGGVVLVDFANALYFGNNAFLRRFLMPLFTWVDRSAVLKILARSFPERMTDSERLRYRRFQQLRRLWPFSSMWRFLNPHRRLKDRQADLQAR